MANSKQTEKRCEWVGDDPLMTAYHDAEWGVPVHDDRELFELLILEGAQAGLSWRTILNKRENYRAAFANFAPEKIARFNKAKVARLMADAGIVRNRLKIAAAITNAKAVLKLHRETETLDSYIWDFVDGQPIVNKWKTIADVPPQTDVSDRMSKDLKSRGFKFVGSTICYAFMQAAGLVNDHVVSCFRHPAV